MSKIDPPAGWPDVDGIDTFERLLGGPVPGSPINRSIGNLVSRSKWLRDNMVLASTLSAPSGSDSVGFVQSGPGMVTRTLQSKNRDVVSAADRGLLGNGTDETEALQNLFDAAVGKVLMLEAGKTYGISTVTGLTIPANTTLISNGAKFKRTSALVGPATDASYNIVIGDNTTIDRLEVDCVGGFNDISGVRVAGSNVHIGLLKINTPSRAAAQGGAWVGAKIGPDTGTARNVVVDRIEGDLWDRAFTVQNVTGGAIGYVDIQRYMRGLYLNNCKDFKVYGGHIRTGSAGNTGKAGENGILIESTTADYSTERVRIENVTVENSGEHGFRIGGQKIMRDVWHVNCLARGTGAGFGPAPPPNDDDHGGCGFKALGPTSVNGARHQNIYYVDCVAESLVLDSLTDRPNFAGFHVAKCYNVHLVSPSVRPTISANSYTAPSVYSCLRGIEVLGCENCSISSPVIVGAKQAGIMIYDAENAGGVDWGPLSNVKITGGEVITANASLPAEAAVEIQCAWITMRRITIDGLLCEGGNYAVKCTVSGSGVLNSPSCGITTWNQVTETLNGCSAWIVQVRGQFIGANACRNGSSFNDWGNGTFRVMKAGTWVTL